GRLVAGHGLAAGPRAVEDPDQVAVGVHHATRLPLFFLGAGAFLSAGLLDFFAPSARLRTLASCSCTMPASRSRRSWQRVFMSGVALKIAYCVGSASVITARSPWRKPANCRVTASGLSPSSLRQATNASTETVPAFTSSSMAGRLKR